MLHARRLSTRGNPAPGATPRVLALLIGLVGAMPAGAQVRSRLPDSTVAAGTVTVAGVVRSVAGHPLAGAELRIGQRLRTYSDSTGAFTMRGVPPGALQLLARRIGHQPTSIDLETASAGQRIDVDVRLAPTTARLETIIVEGEAVDRGLFDAGYYRRARTARGRFLDPDFLATFGGSGVSTLARETPRVMVEGSNGEFYAYSPIAGGRCRMHVFVDGKYRREAMPDPLGGKGLPLDQVVPREDIHAMEIYPTFTSVPAEFTRIGPAPGSQGGMNAIARLGRPGQARSTPRAGTRATDGADNNDSACGAILIWTKTFTARQ